MALNRKTLIKTKLTDAERYKRFVEAAKKVEASDNIEDFNRAFDRLVTKPPRKVEKQDGS
jgi:hypothetical protein